MDTIKMPECLKGS